MKEDIKFYKPKSIPELTVLDAQISDFRYDVHAHDDYAIGMTLKGNQCFYCNGQHYETGPGAIIQINPEEAHDGFAGNEEGLMYKMIYIPRNVINELDMNTSYNFSFTDTVTYNPDIQNAFKGFTEELDESDKDMNHGEDALYQFVLKLIEHNDLKMSDSDFKEKYDFVCRSINYIHQNIDGKIELDDLCSLVGVSKYHFIRTFKKVTNRTPYQYILDLKLDKARKELELGIAPIIIAERYGFYDLSHLIHRFKKAYGITPYQYQQSFR